MSVVENTSNANQLRYPGQRRIDRQSSTGHLFYLTWSGTNTFRLYRSTDNGASWAAFGSSKAAADVMLDIGGLHIDWQNRLYFTYRTNTSLYDRIYMQAAVITSTGPSWHSPLLIASGSNHGIAGETLTGSSLVVVRHNDGRSTGVVGAAYGQTKAGLSLYGFTIPASGQPVVNNTVISGTRTWEATASAPGVIRPAMGYEFSPAHLWATFGRDYMYAIKASWNGAGWTTPSSAVRITPGTPGVSTAPLELESVAALWRNPGWMVAQPTPEDQTTILLSERNQANTFTTYKVSPTHPTGNIRNCAIAANYYSKDVRVYAVGTSTDVVYYCDYIASTGLFTSWATVDGLSVTNANNYTVRKDNYQSANFDVLTQSGVSLWPITHTAQKATYAPYVPAWDETTMGRPNGSAADVAQPLLLQWIFSDPDANDTQSAWALSRVIGTGTIEYFRASDNTWQATEQKNTGSTTNRTLAAAWGVDGDPVHTFQVKVWDQADTASNYSVGYVVLPSAKANPSLSLSEVQDINTGLDTGFETGITGFIGVNGTLTQSSTFAHTGTYSAKLVSAAASYPKIRRSGNDPVVTGQQYTFDAWLYVPSSLGQQAYVSLEWYNGTSLVSEDSTQITLPVGAWTNVSVTASAPGGITGCRRVVGIVGTAPAGLELYVDDAMVLAPWSGTVHTDTIVASWFVTEMTAYRITLATNPGGEEVYDSGWLASTEDYTHTIPYRVPDGTTWTVGLQTRNNDGLESDIDTAGFFVDYEEPPTPTCTLTPLPDSGVIRVAIENPTPQGAQPDVVEQQLYRRPRIYTNLLPNPSFDDLETATFEDFEDTTYVNTWAFSGPGGVWVRDNARAYAGSWSFRSPATIIDGQKADWDIDVPAGAAAIRVRYWVSSEKGFDWFRITNFTTDAVLFQDSGVASDWREAQVDIPIGQTKITLRYIKDSNTSSGDDAVWVDNVEFLAPAAAGSGYIEIDATAALSSAQAHTGVFSTKLIPNGVGNFPRYDGPYVALTGAMRAGGWVYAEAGTSPLKIAIHAFDAAGGYIATRGQLNSTAQVGQWVYLETTADFADLDNVTLCTATLGRGDGITAPSASDIFYVDDYELTPYDRNTGTLLASGVLTSAGAQETIVLDTFTRTVAAGGWDIPDTPNTEAWAVGGGAASAFYVGGSAGHISVSTLNVGYRATITGAQDVDIVSIFSLPVEPTGGPIVCGLLARYTDSSNFYLAEMVVNTNLTVTAQIRKNVAGSLTSVASTGAIAGLTHYANRLYRVRFVVEGTSLRVRVWSTDTTEPSTWNIDTADSSLNPVTSKLGYRVGLDAANTNTLPVDIFVDAMLAQGFAGGGSSAATVDDWQPASGVEYEYRVIANASNGTSAVSPWTA